MKALFLFVAFACGLNTVAAINGQFDTSGGSSCKWSERKYDEDVRSIFLECICVGDAGKEMSYSCEYFGNPFECGLFLKRGGAERFYHQISEHMKGDYNLK